MRRRPVHKVCPDCGSAVYKRAPLGLAFLLVHDRICRVCGTRYTPPTPSWLNVLAILAAFPLLLAGAGGMSVVILSSHDPSGALFVGLFSLLLIWLGGAALFQVIRGFSEVPGNPTRGFPVVPLGGQEHGVSPVIPAENRSGRRDQPPP